MSKLCIIGDMHFGVKAGNQDFLDFQLWWLEECLKKLQAMGITTIVQTGDMLDVRQYIKLNVLHALIHKFPQLLKKYGIKEWIIYGGNHEMFYRESNEICSLDILPLMGDKELSFILYKDEVGITEIGGKKFAFVPWLNKNNQTRLLSDIPKSTDYVFGHFEMVGMPMVPGGAVCEHGLAIPTFAKYKRVISGHFHTVSQHLNCTMVGTPYHLNWGDTLDGNNRGFWILDTETDDLVLHKNEDHMTLFSVIEYSPTETYNEEFFEVYEGSLVKVLVKEKPDAKHFKKFSDLLNRAKMIDFKIIDTTMVQIEKVEISEEVLSVDTLTAMNKFIDGQSEDFDKDGVKELAKMIYIKAINNG